MANKIKKYGLVGYPLGHSFSKDFFARKFANEGIDAEYVNFEIDNISLSYPSGMLAGSMALIAAQTSSISSQVVGTLIPLLSKKVLL